MLLQSYEIKLPDGFFLANCHSLLGFISVDSQGSEIIFNISFMVQQSLTKATTMQCKTLANNS